jgi:hypothetical protein
MLTFGVLALACAFQCANAQEAPSAARALTVTKAEGKIMKVSLTPSISLNTDSMLRRGWYAITDPASPVGIEGTPGIDVVYNSQARSSGYEYRVDFGVVPKEPISAVDVRVVVLDVFGRHLRTLQAVYVLDTDRARYFSGIWTILREAEATAAHTSIIYVANVRTAAGRIYTAGSKEITEQIKKVSGRAFSDAGLDPTQ